MWKNVGMITNVEEERNAVPMGAVTLVFQLDQVGGGWKKTVAESGEGLY